ncbi:hypothetical protein [Arthrobacter sp. efr-133-TYG-118]|uniref:hypothetical protein n=1 Tax=Arthrobacter sp. efr-133-TYG-118 TaxID=3040279 RepID=UPI00254C940B|nr:hypothetical protein [Arthrobacter sp. efr-133-TYG-118]
MQITLTIGPLTDPSEQDDPASYQKVKAEGPDYDTALQNARGLVPDGYRVLNIRTD